MVDVEAINFPSYIKNYKDPGVNKNSEVKELKPV